MSNRLWFWQIINGVKQVAGYKHYYINRQGQVFKMDENGSLSPRKSSVDSNGYIQISLRENKIRKKHYVHRLLAQTFLSDFSDDLQVDHIDGNKNNNNLSNLRMVTAQQNHFNRTTAKGYSWHKGAKKWQACIRFDGKLIYLGYYNNKIEAREAYLTAKEKYHFIPDNQLPTEA